MGQGSPLFFILFMNGGYTQNGVLMMAVREREREAGMIGIGTGKAAWTSAYTVAGVDTSCSADGFYELAEPDDVKKIATS